MSKQQFKEVSYAHRDAPNGTRYIGDASEKLPVWAVDVKPYDSSMMNSMGHPRHPTDDLLTGHETIGEMLKFRDAYDRVAAAGLLDALDTLQVAVKNKASMNQAELDAGEDL